MFLALNDGATSYRALADGWTATVAAPEFADQPADAALTCGRALDRNAT